MEVSDRFRTRGPARLHMGLLPLPVCHIYCHDKPGKHLFNTKVISSLMYVVMNGSRYSLYNNIVLKFTIVIISSDTIRQYDKFKRQLLNSNHRCLFIFLIIVYSKLVYSKNKLYLVYKSKIHLSQENHFIVNKTSFQYLYSLSSLIRFDHL